MSDYGVHHYGEYACGDCRYEHNDSEDGNESSDEDTDDEQACLVPHVADHGNEGNCEEDGATE